MKGIKKKSLFTKLMATYVVIIIIAYSVSAIILSVWFYNYYYNQRKDALLREEANLNRIVDDYLTQKTDAEKFKFELLVIDRLLDARILVVDNFGYVISYSGQGLDKMIGKQITSEEFDEIREGRIVVKKGNFKNMFSSPMLTVGMPVVVHDQVQGAVFLHSPLDEIKSAVKQAYIVVWLSAALAIMFSIFVIYIFSDRILIRPLEKINNTAKSIAKGEFDKRVQVNSDDEIGDLAVSFNYMADSLKNLENMRKNFIANISHELRSPLTSINGFISGMIDGTIPQEKWVYYLHIVSDEIQRLTRLINDLLDLARLESGEFSLKIDKFDINELIRERVIKFEDRINKKNINMDVILIEDKVMVMGDRDRIDQVITNLLDNAIKFVPEMGHVYIKAEIKNDRVFVSVFNDGDPIPKDEIKYIWDRFHKVDKARCKGGGTGLGLSIARQIINQHNQTIWVESGDFGTKFTFTLLLA